TTSYMFFTCLTCYVQLRLLYSFPTRRSSDLYTDRDRLRLEGDSLRFCVISDNLPADYHRELATELAATQLLEARIVEVDPPRPRSEEHTSELQSRFDLVCRLLLEKKN